LLLASQFGSRACASRIVPLSLRVLEPPHRGEFAADRPPRSEAIQHPSDRASTPSLHLFQLARGGLFRNRSSKRHAPAPCRPRQERRPVVMSATRFFLEQVATAGRLPPPLSPIAWERAISATSLECCSVLRNPVAKGAAKPRARFAGTPHSPQHGGQAHVGKRAANSRKDGVISQSIARQARSTQSAALDRGTRCSRPWRLGQVGRGGVMGGRGGGAGGAGGGGCAGLFVVGFCVGWVGLGGRGVEQYFAG
jgi:hypothetical protein